MKLVNEFTVSVSADKAWGVLWEEFGNISKWLTSMQSSHLKGMLGKGAERVCVHEGIGPFPASKITEEIVHIDVSNYEYTYVAREGMPWFINSAQNTWSVTPVDNNKCVIRTVARIEVKWIVLPFAWMLPMLLKTGLGDVFEELKYAIEYGKARPCPSSIKTE